MSKFIPTKEFMLKYGVNDDTFQVKKSRGEFPKNIIVKRERGNSLIDENFFIKRSDFKRKVWDECHDNYYFLTKHFSNSDLARGLHAIDNTKAISAWIQFMQIDLFSLPREGIFAYNINKEMWRFYRYSRWLVRGAFLLAEVKPENRKVSVLLERY